MHINKRNNNKSCCQHRFLCVFGKRNLTRKKRILNFFGNSHRETKVSISHSDGCVSFAYTISD